MSKKHHEDPTAYDDLTEPTPAEQVPVPLDTTPPEPATKEDPPPPPPTTPESDAADALITMLEARADARSQEVCFALDHLHTIRQTLTLLPAPEPPAGDPPAE